MPFNVSGVFSRLYNWVADRDNGIKIMAARMDGEADDVAAAINAIVSQSQPFINPIKAPNGTLGAPGYSFDSDTNSGFYRVAENQIGIVVNGALVATATVNGLEMTLPMIASAGTAALPSIAFPSDPNTGIYHVGADQIGISTGGTQRVALSTTGITVNLPISGTAVTQSSTDVTAGRLLKTLDYGLGQIIEYSGNINSTGLLPTGFYRVLAGATGTKPDFAASFNLISLVRGTSPYADSVQIAIGSGTGANVAIRSTDGTSWSDWRLLYSQANILGTVSQSGGTPTGSIIQRGSNGNGEFVRFSDGTQICHNTFTSGGGTTTAAGSVFVSADDTWTFPQAFTTATNMVVCGSPGNGSRWLTFPSQSASSTGVRQYSHASGAGTASLNVMAIGRWF